MSQHHLAHRTAVPAPPQAYESYGHAPVHSGPSPEHERRQERSPRPGERRGGRRRAPKRQPLLGNYLGYAATFVGAGLISGAIVHHPLDPARYTVIAVIGAVVFLCATVLSEFVLTKQRPNASRVLGLVAASLALSFGIGMLSGGLQHFEDFPERGAMLIPLGLTLSFIAYVLRHEPARWRSIVGPAGVLVVVTAALAFVGLRGIADGMAGEPGGGGGHSHGEEAPSEPADGEPGHDAEPENQAPASASSPADDPGAAKTEGTGHAEDGHGH
ncbi:hypothetical protein PV396_43500 [Streptomyces sp. ME02-8801-2C]|uniref:hypothetical protein n=1 Tax=Streptomyces sp. ME02-8801-2C TaxID=3028680 RepID=UPI0029A5D5CA|nr:hypothetical protein [Streptomyces sp. ME02-8801-2C]MDX3458717.1 hypothetical protein [Streptomyces sp. ME02-8801-2C]